MARRKTPVRKAAKLKKTVRRARKPVDKLDSEEVAFLFDRLQAEERSEKLWHEMTAPVAEEGDTWVEVKEHLLVRHAVREDHERRWKFFGK
ncbi:MAG: hypothetical protein HYZ75_18260 [Elusimicrobia bacterium]|nr:hypothetical protein [Elusimicrobiota bacterium]